ncbi:MAG: histidinol-phosphate transaminase [Pseudomonadota bacterium]
MSALDLARQALLHRQGYTSAVGRFDMTRLHANELPELDDDCQWNRYPPPRPTELCERIGEQLGLPASSVLVTRGSNEGIDLLCRAFCEPGERIVTCSPTFGMYRVCAEVQGASEIDVPLDVDFDLDVDAIERAAQHPSVKLVFVCSPANPTGNHVSIERLRTLCDSLASQAVIVLDQAYIEFSDDGRLTDLLASYDNLVVLRTFSKAYGLAGLRCGAVLANTPIITLLDSLLAPYSTPIPTIEGVLEALSEPGLVRAQARLAEVQRQKRRLLRYLQQCPLVECIYPSDTNFLLIKSPKANALFQHVHDRGILIRSFMALPRLEQCVRITVGNEVETTQLIAAIEELCCDT